MKPSSSSVVALVLAVATTSGVACGEALPTQATVDEAPVSFALSDASARAFTTALDDARDRIVPTLGAGDATRPLAAVLDELTSAIAKHDQRALRQALARADIALGMLERGAAAADIASELDVVRLILDHARTLAAPRQTARGEL